MNILRQKVYGLASGGSLGTKLYNPVRPLLISKPIKPKREMASTSSMSHSIYNCARHIRKKLLSQSIPGKQEICGFDNGLYGPVGFASHVENERVALEARVLPKQLPAPELPQCINWIDENLSKILPKLHRVKPVLFEEYLRRSGSSPTVKKTLRLAHERLVKAGITCDTPLTAQQIHSWTTRSSFVKVENLSYHSPLGLKEKAPRLIQGAQPEFVVLVGPSIMALQDLVSRRWRPGKSNLVFTSGITAERAAAHVTSIPGQSGFDDISTFDLDQSSPWGEAFVKWCKKWHFPVATLQLMKGNIDTHGKTHHGWKYKCAGTRKSGDPYTTLFNTMINLFTHLYLYCKYTGKTVEEARWTFFMVAQGDDNAFVHTEPDRFPWREGMLSLGFDSEATYCSLVELEFCSMRLYSTDQGWTFGPKPGRVLSRFGYSINKPDHVPAGSYLRGVAKSQIDQFGFIPILGSLYSRILELTREFEGKEYYAREWTEHQMRVTQKHTGIGIMSALCENYYWTPLRQRRFEELIGNMKLGDPWPVWVQQLLFDRDTDGVKVTFSR